MTLAVSILTLKEARTMPPSLNEIAETVCRVMKVGRLDFNSLRRAPHIIEARHVFYWFARNFTARSYPQIGMFCDRDHSTIVHGVRRVDAKLDALWPRLVEVAERLNLDLQDRQNGLSSRGQNLNKVPQSHVQVV